MPVSGYRSCERRYCEAVSNLNVDAQLFRYFALKQTNLRAGVNFPLADCHSVIESQDDFDGDAASPGVVAAVAAER